MSPKKHYNVVAAIIFLDGKVLCTQRGPSKYKYVAYKYEFPGGKIEEGETEEEALVREIEEELNLKVHIKELFVTVEHEYPDFKIKMDAFLCEPDVKQFTLNEHFHFQCLGIENLNSLDWAEADIPIVNKLQSKKKN